MKINLLKINGFGKIKDKEINLDNKINIIYGKNESGKSTIQKFIPGVLYGLSKNKNGKELSDFDKYYPWNAIDFSGKIQYTLDNGEEYEVFRDFLKKNPIIYDNKKRDITSNFKIDKNKGITFFEEQTEIDEKTFLDTAITEQQNVKLSKSSQNNIVQKITNLVSSGDENISYKNTIEKISKMQNDKIGSTRTSQKPINIIDNKITDLEKEKYELQDLTIEKEEIDKEIEILKKELEDNTNKLYLLKDMKEYLNSSKIKVAELDFNKQLEEEYDEKILDLKNKIDIRARQNIRLKKTNYIPKYVFIGILIFISIILQLVLKKVLITVVPIILSMLVIVWIIVDKIIKNKKVKEKLNQIEELQEKINKEIEILKKGKEEKSFQTKIKNERLYMDIQKNEENLINKYSGNIELDYIQNVLSLETNDIILMIQNIEEEIESQKFKIHTLTQEKNNIEIDIEEYKNTNSKLDNLIIEKEELISLNKSFELAKKCLEEAYQEMKDKIRPTLTLNLCEMVEKISNGKYTNIIFDDENGLCVELDNGQYIPVDRLSIGTIDQLYLSLRISVIEEITKEKMPIILDEAFAYFDNERLENLLGYINQKYSENQIIIFTCSNREKDSLKHLGVAEYNLVEI